MSRIYWRKSSKWGFHFYWNCQRNNCPTCHNNRLTFDDPGRYARDASKRDAAMSNILWDTKRGKQAGKWNYIKRWSK